MKKQSKKFLGLLMALALTLNSLGLGPVFAEDAATGGAPAVEQDAGEVDSASGRELSGIENGGNTGESQAPEDEGTETENPQNPAAGEGKDAEEALNPPAATEDPEAPGIMDRLAGFFSEEPKDLGNIFEFKNLWLGREYNENGTIKTEGTEIESGTPVELENGATITIRYNWSVIGKGAKNGDMASIALPDIFDISGSFPESPILLTDGTNVGTWTVSDRLLKFTFNEGIKGVDQNNLTGTFIELGFGLNMSKFEEETSQVVDFGDGINKNFELVAKPDTSKAESISKLGMPNVSASGGKYKDPTTITWQIDVLNTEATTLTGAAVYETSIPAGLELVKGSFTISNLSMKIDGAAVKKGDASSIVASYPDGKAFAVSLPDLQAYKGYRIEYKTKIKDFSKTSFENTAFLDKGEGGPLSATSTVGNIERSAAIEKTWQADGSDKIKWTIYVNKGGITIDHPVIKDNLPEGLKIESVKVFKKQGTSEYAMTNSSDNQITISELAPHLTVELPEIEAADVYKIEYITIIDYSKVNGGNYQEKNKFENEASLYNRVDGTDNIIGEAVKAQATTTREHLLSKDGKNPGQYGDTLTWTLSVNKAYHTITNAVLHDIIPANLEFNPSDVKIEKKSKGGTFIELTDTDKPEVSAMDESRKATINLGTITEEYRITYTTKIKPEGFAEGATFKNHAWLTGGNRGEGVGNGGSQDNPAYKDLTPPDNRYTKSHSSTDYDKKTIDWKIESDPIKEGIENLKIVDTFPNKGLILIKSSLKIHVGGVELDSGQFTLDPNTENGESGYHKGFTITFKEGYTLKNAKMTISYTTSYDPQYKDAEDHSPENFVDSEGNAKIYKNQALVTGTTESGKEVNKTLDADTLTGGAGNNDSTWNSGKKEGKRVYLDGSEVKLGWVSGKDRLIEWQLFVNYLRQDLGSNVTVTDTLGYEGKIDLASVEIKKYTVNSGDGSTMIGEGALSSTEYVKSLSEDGKTLTVKFNNSVSERYAIIYRTTVPEKSQSVYQNGAMLKAGGKEYPYSASVSYSQADSYINKTSDVPPGTSQVYTDDIINWSIAVNESLSQNMENVVITDTMAAGLMLDKASLKVYRVEGAKEVLVGSGDTSSSGAYTSSSTVNENGTTTLTVNFNESISHKYIICYATIVTAKSGSVSNKAEVTGSYVESKKTSGIEYSAEKFGFTGGASPAKGKIRVEKQNTKGDIVKNNPMKFKLYYKVNGEKIYLEGEFNTNHQGYVEIPNLSLRTYYLEETQAPKGFEKLTEDQTIVVNQKFNDKSENIIPAVVKNGNIKTSVTGKKSWSGGPAEKPSIELQLYQNGISMGEDYKVELDGSESVPWTHTWTDLNKTDISGDDIKYTVDEVDVPSGYAKSYSGDGLIITNTYHSEIKDIKGTKSWIGGDHDRPSQIYLQLYRQIEGREPEPIGSPVKLEKGVFEHVWKEQEEHDINKKTYTYFVKEVDENGQDFVPENYTKIEEGLTVTNTYQISKTSITGKKVWSGGPAEKPTIALQLYRDGIAIGEPVELKNGVVSHTWDHLDKTDAEGVPYKYTVDEVKVPINYQKNISEDGLTVTNTYRSPGGGGGGWTPKPTDPEKPLDPEKPIDPEKPLEPEQPTKPEETQKPEIPVDENKVPMVIPPNPNPSKLRVVDGIDIDDDSIPLATRWEKYKEWLELQEEPIPLATVPKTGIGYVDYASVLSSSYIVTIDAILEEDKKKK